MVKCGPIEDLFIYYHPVTNKHLGIGRVIFENVKGARQCVDKLNNTSVMGKILAVFLDPFGDKCKAKFKDFTEEKKPVVEEKKVEEKKVEVEKHFLESKDKHPLEKEKEDDLRSVVMKDSLRDSRDRYSRSYVRSDYPTPSSADLGYGTSQSDYSANYGSTNSTPIR